MVRNDRLLRHLMSIRDGVPSEFGIGELNIANATARQHGFMDKGLQITADGHKWLNSSPKLDRNERVAMAQDILRQVMPPLVFSAMREIVEGGMGLEEFERKHGIASRSAKVVVSIGEEMAKRVAAYSR